MSRAKKGGRDVSFPGFQSRSSPVHLPFPDEDDTIMTRRLNDGRTFRILKNLPRRPDDARCAGSEWAEDRRAGNSSVFQYGIGEKVAG
jgi:hypothetical protein